ncbi:MAG: type I methionyl aminopeptidase [Nitrospiraceae bacterium]|nr:type I methionyl aminopeptidase [Nitrospiraceae bacterium]
MILIKSAGEIEIMASAGRICALALEAVKGIIAPGISTKEIEKFAHDLIKKEGGQPAFLGYRGYPAAVCVSINEQVVHGIPTGRKLREGDIASVDLGVYYKGFYGDAAKTFAVGEVSPEARKLMRVTEESLDLGISRAVAGARLSDISHAIQTHAEENGFSVVRSFVGHGIGRALHEEPQVPNFGPPGKGPRLLRGMALAIEPMVNAGSWKVRVLGDGWTAVTEDGRLSAHYEHTVIVDEGQPSVLTRLS